MSPCNVFKERDPTKGSIIKNTICMALPLWLNTGFWTGVHIFNLFWVSKLGAEAVAAVAIGGTAFMLLMVPIQGLVTATYGMVGGFDRNNKAGLEKLVKEILFLLLVISLFLVFSGYFFAPVLLKLLGAEAKVTSLAVIYLRICAVGGIFSFFLWPINSMIRSTRDLVRPMMIVGLVILLQGIFDYLFILGNLGFPKMGVAGAGLSLALSAAIGAVISFWLLSTGKSFIRISFKNWRDFLVKSETVKEITNLAGFDTMEGIARVIGDMIFIAIVAPFGTAVLAAYAIVGQRLFRYLSVLGMDLGIVTAITVSNNLGANDIKRAEKSAWLICGLSGLMTTLGGLALFVFADKIFGFFIQTPEVTGAGINYARIAVFGLVFSAAGMILRRAFAGAKETKIPMLIYFLMGVIQIGLALILPNFFGLGVNGVWLALLVGMIFYGSTLAILFKLGRWKSA